MFCSVTIHNTTGNTFIKLFNKTTSFPLLFVFRPSIALVSERLSGRMRNISQRNEFPAFIGGQEQVVREIVPGNE